VGLPNKTHCVFWGMCSGVSILSGIHPLLGAEVEWPVFFSITVGHQTVTLNTFYCSYIWGAWWQRL